METSSTISVEDVYISVIITSWPSYAKMYQNLEITMVNITKQNGKHRFAILVRNLAQEATSQLSLSKIVLT